MSQEEGQIEVTSMVGRAITLTFNESCGAGYLWSCENADPESLDITSATQATDSRAVGGPLKRTFTVKASKEGEWTLTFVHKRPWNDEVANRVKVKLIIGPQAG